MYHLTSKSVFMEYAIRCENIVLDVRCLGVVNSFPIHGIGTVTIGYTMVLNSDVGSALKLTPHLVPTVTICMLIVRDSLNVCSVTRIFLSSVGSEIIEEPI